MNSETKVFPTIDPAAFRRQMEIFDRMREIDAEAQARAEKARAEQQAPRFQLLIYNSWEVGEA